jgi:16S rRNA (cytosine967-C5)-methyltransferase
MPVHAAQLGAAVDALRLILPFEYPADSVLSRYFREESQLGQHDRSFIAESVFGVLRRKRGLDHLVGARGPRHLLLAWLLRHGGHSVRELEPFLKGEDAQWAARMKSATLDDAPLGVQADLPDWIVDHLQAQMADTEILALGSALQRAAPLDLRVNTLLADREKAKAELGESGVATQFTPYSPLGLRAEGKPALNRHRAFLEGHVEVQDEGSQLLGFLLAPRRGELVVDFCAGAGGKSLMLGAMMQSKGRVYAFDVSASRLTRLKPRLKRSGLSNLHPHQINNENDIKIKRLKGKIDRVLVDAPCSGLGTLRRNPDLKWRQSPEGLAELRGKQASILRAAATLVKPGGRLVYATCSLLAVENQEVVAGFLAEHPEYEALHCGQILEQQRIPLAAGEQLQLWPHVHATDGFFAAALQRK